MGYFGFLCAAEFTVPNLASFSPAVHLSVADIAVDSLQLPTCLRVRIKASKTDLFRQGFHIHIGLGRVPLCAVHTLLAYLSERGNTPGPFFLLANGQPLSLTILTDWLQQIFSTAGIGRNFSSHSFHIGAATVAAYNHLIQAHGRWTSNAYQRLYPHTFGSSRGHLRSALCVLAVGYPQLPQHCSQVRHRITPGSHLSFLVSLSVSCLHLVSVCLFSHATAHCAWCLGLLELEDPFHPCSLALPFQAPSRFQLGGGPLPGLLWRPPPHSRALAGSTNFVGTNAQAHLWVMS